METSGNLQSGQQHASVKPSSEFTFGDVIRSLLGQIRVDSAEGNWWQHGYLDGQMLPFVVLFVRSENVAADTYSRTLYRLGNFFRAGQGINPTTEELSPLRSHVLAYADRHHFTFAVEGAAFLAWNSPSNPFFEEDLPSHLKDQYFLLYLIALQERLSLFQISRHVSDRWLDAACRERAAAFDQIQQMFLEFTARGYFAQATQRSHHQRFYQRCMRVLEVPELFSEVDGEIGEMASAARLQLDRELSSAQSWLGTVVGLIGVVVGAPSLALAIMGLDVAEWPAPWSLWQVAGVTVGAAALVGTLVIALWFYKRLRRGPR